MENQPHHSESDTRVSTSGIAQQREHIQEAPTALATESHCGIDAQSLEETIADKQEELGKTALTTFAKMRTDLDDFFLES